MDGVHNRSLFQTKSRDARKKLARMGGIMSSSPQLLQAGGMTNGPSPAATSPIMRPPMGYNMGGKITSPGPYPTNYFGGGAAIPLIQQAGRFVGSKIPSMEKIGRTLGISDNSLAAGMSANPKLTAGLLSGGTAIAGNKVYQQLTQDKKEETAAIEAKMSLNDLVADVQAKIEAGENISAEVAQQLIEQLMPGPTPEDKKEFLNKTGNDSSDMRNLDAINDKIMQVAIAGTIGKSPEALNKAILGGLQNYQQTALARATAAQGGKSNAYTPERLRQSLVQQLSAMGEEEKVAQGLLIEDKDETGKTILLPGLTEEQWIMKMMTLGGTGASTPAPVSNPSKLRQQLEEALKSNPGQKQQILDKAKEMGVDITGLE